MSELFLLADATEPPVEIMPALGLLLHTVRTGPADMMAFEDAAAADAILIDARRDLIPARRLCQLLRRSAPQAPVLVLMTEGGLTGVSAEWGADDVVLSSAGPAELEARLRLAIGRQASAVPAASDEIRSGELSIDEATYTARLRAKLGPEHEALIGTVRNVGYRFVPLKSGGEDGRRGPLRDAEPGRGTAANGMAGEPAASSTITGRARLPGTAEG